MILDLISKMLKRWKPVDIKFKGLLLVRGLKSLMKWC